MHNYLIALGIGIAAGVVDVVPMMLQRLDKFSCASAFIHWVVLGLIIPFVSWDMSPLLKGSLIALMTALPVMLLVFPQDAKAVVPMILFSILLGAAVGFAGARFVA